MSLVSVSLPEPNPSTLVEPQISIRNKPTGIKTNYPRIESPSILKLKIDMSHVTSAKWLRKASTNQINLW